MKVKLMNTLIPGIKKAIESDRIILSEMLKECDTVMPVIKSAHYLDASIVDRAQAQYDSKIDGRRQSIERMEENLMKMEKKAGEKEWILLKLSGKTAGAA